MFLGYRLKLLRKQRRLSQSELGKLLGVSKVSISGYEKGTRVPSMENFLTILNVFNISADYILGREINVVCENDSDQTLLISSDDIDIIRVLREKTNLYYKIIKNPKTFFNSINENNI